MHYTQFAKVRQKQRRDEKRKRVADGFVIHPDTCYVFADGSCVSRTGIGGWGTVLYYNGHMKFAAGGKPETTNNEMEITAILEGLRLIKRPDARVNVVSDSNYAKLACFELGHRWRENGWLTSSGSAVKNQALIEEVLAERVRFTNCKFVWVPGHGGVPLNEAADVLATMGRLQHGRTGGRICMKELSADLSWAEGWITE